MDVETCNLLSVCQGIVKCSLLLYYLCLSCVLTLPLSKSLEEWKSHLLWRETKVFLWRPIKNNGRTQTPRYVKLELGSCEGCWERGDSKISGRESALTSKSHFITLSPNTYRIPIMCQALFLEQVRPILVRITIRNNVDLLWYKHLQRALGTQRGLRGLSREMGRGREWYL